MANNALQIIGLVISLVAGLCTMLAVILPDWRKNDPSLDVIEATITHQGIWLRCITYSTGQWQCDDFDGFFLGLSVQVQVARGLAMIACVFGGFALLLSIFGMECTKCMDDGKMKNRVAKVAAVFWMFSSFSIGVAVSYYGHQVVQEYNALALLPSMDVGRRYVFGTSLFLGWAAMGVGILGGALMLCGSAYVEKEDEEYWNRGRVGQGLKRMRESFRESYRAVRPMQREKQTDYV